MGLYSFVYAGKLSILTVCFLFVSFMIQPIHSAFANESETEEVVEAEPATPKKAEPVAEHHATPETQTEDVENNETATVDETSIEEPEKSPEQESESESSEVRDGETIPSTTSEEISEQEASSTDSTSLESDVSSTSSTTVDQSTSETDTTTATTTASTTTSTSTPSPAATSTASSTTLTPEEVSTTTSTTTSDSLSTTTSEIVGGGSSTDDSEESRVDTSMGSSSTTTTDMSGEDQATIESDSSDQSSEDDNQPSGVTEENIKEALITATTSDLIRKVVESIDYLVTEENYYQFSKQSCVMVGEGAFHCSENKEKVIDSNAVVYSELGENMNLEIFIKTSKGKVKQITDNQYEDASPHYDPESRQIAWQRLIDGRYQIILYNLDTEEETQLTFSRTNSMEPAVSKEGVVWQEWDNNDWEIMFFDGTYTDQLTDNGTQDLDPVIEDEYVIWTVIGENSQFAQVYSIASKEVVTINNHDGGSIVNPRFVLVYDTQFENGDIVTQKFDPDTGFSLPVAARSAPEPIDIPEADTTGEIRALIQNKGSSKDSGKVVVDNATDDDTLKISADDEETLIVVASTTPDEIGDIATGTASSSEDFLELTEFDLVITAEEAASAMAASSTPVKVSSSTQE